MAGGISFSFLGVLGSKEPSDLNESPNNEELEFPLRKGVDGVPPAWGGDPNSSKKVNSGGGVF